MPRLHLVRHAQASWGSVDYDQLSPTGYQQARMLGSSAGAPLHAEQDIVTGTMLRHNQTASTAMTAAGIDAPIARDEGWNEFDHVAIGRAFDPSVAATDTERYFEVVNAGIDAWLAGEGHHAETYREFGRRVMEAYRRAATRAEELGRDVVVFSSTGPISIVVSHILAGDDSLFNHLRGSYVNTALTRIDVAAGRLVSYNEYGHLNPALVTNH